MATTSNYGWTTPDDTALVKDGASAIRSLGTAIDTSLNTALGTKKAGMVLLNTTSFSGVSSVSLAANSFTSTYTNYKLVITCKHATTANDLLLRLRTSGTDNSNNSYRWGRMYVGTNAATVFGSSSNNTSTSVTIGEIDANMGLNIIEISNPIAAERTAYSGSSTNTLLQLAAGFFDNTTSFDACTFYPNGGGNITGTYSLYGYNV
jgi:hypothetical protein